MGGQTRDRWGVSMDSPQELEPLLRDGACTFGSKVWVDLEKSKALSIHRGDPITVRGPVSYIEGSLFPSGSHCVVIQVRPNSKEKRHQGVRIWQPWHPPHGRHPGFGERCLFRRAVRVARRLPLPWRPRAFTRRNATARARESVFAGADGADVAASPELACTQRAARLQGRPRRSDKPAAARDGKERKQREHRSPIAPSPAQRRKRREGRGHRRPL